MGRFVSGVANSVPYASFGPVSPAKCDEKNGFVFHKINMHDGDFVVNLLFWQIGDV